MVQALNTGLIMVNMKFGLVFLLLMDTFDLFMPGISENFTQNKQYNAKNPIPSNHFSIEILTYVHQYICWGVQ